MIVSTDGNARMMGEPLPCRRFSGAAARVRHCESSKACAREMVLGETSDEATGSSCDVATNTKFAVTTPDDDMAMAALAVVGAVAIHKR